MQDSCKILHHLEVKCPLSCMSLADLARFLPLQGKCPLSYSHSKNLTKTIARHFPLLWDHNHNCSITMHADYLRNNPEFTQHHNTQNKAIDYVSLVCALRDTTVITGDLGSAKEFLYALPNVLSVTCIFLIAIHLVQISHALHKLTNILTIFLSIMANFLKLSAM